MLLDLPRSSLSRCAARIGVHISTVHRWRLQGVRGCRLGTVVIGGQLFVLDEDLEAFLTALNADREVSAANLADRADAAGKMLDAMGVHNEKGGR